MEGVGSKTSKERLSQRGLQASKTFRSSNTSGELADRPKPHTFAHRYGELGGSGSRDLRGSRDLETEDPG